MSAASGMRVLVTGAGGFVGRALIPVLLKRGMRVRGTMRRADIRPAAASDAEMLQVGDIGAATDWTAALDGIDAVVHLAARVHQMRDKAGDPLAAHRAVNVAGTERLALAAARSGVRRMVLLSTVKVLGEATCGAPFRETDTPRPTDPYSISKWEAEQALARVGRLHGLETVVLRPPLVYGPGVGANFLRLLRLAASGMPLPLASVRNLRSFVGVENLADAIAMALAAPAAAGETFLVSDGQDLSTSELLRRIAASLGRPARLFPCPPRLLRFMLACAGRRTVAERLLDSLQVDSGKLRGLGWQPPRTVDEGLGELAGWYKTASYNRR